MDGVCPALLDHHEGFKISVEEEDQRWSWTWGLTAVITRDKERPLTDEQRKWCLEMESPPEGAVVTVETTTEALEYHIKSVDKVALGIHRIDCNCKRNSVGTKLSTASGAAEICRRKSVDVVSFSLVLRYCWAGWGCSSGRVRA